MTQLGLAVRENPLASEGHCVAYSLKKGFPMLGKYIIKKASNNKCQILIKSCYCLYFHWNSAIQSMVVRDEGGRALLTDENHS